MCSLALLFFACGGEKSDGNEAARAAKDYYDKLLAGNYTDYMAGIADIDSLPPSYREQLLANAKQFVAQQKNEHGGIAAVNVVSVRTDSTRNATDALLLFCYGDSSKEEVVVPMLERGGRWLMK